MKTATAAADRPSYICEARTDNVAPLRCWKRNGHDGEHLTVKPPLRPDTLTRPLVVRW